MLGEAIEVEALTREKPYRLQSSINPCPEFNWPCSVCGSPLGERQLQVQFVQFDTDPTWPELEILRTEVVCSEGCAIRFVNDGAPAHYNLSSWV